MSKKVKKTTGRKNFDFTIFQEISEGSYPAKIARDLGVSRQVVDYHISSLKDRKLIKMLGQGAWITVQDYKPKESKKSTRVAEPQSDKSFDTLKPDSIRGHAFQFKLGIPNSISKWTNERREKVLKKIGMNYTPLNHIFGGGQKLVINDKKVHLTNKSIILYDKGSYFSENSRESLSLAIENSLNIIKVLEKKLKVSFAEKEKYKIKVTRQHYSMIKNALAMMYNKKTGKNLSVYDDKGLWLIIDNSWNLNELECVHPRTAIDDSEGMQNWMNSMKVTGFKVTPEFILETMNGIQQNQLVFDKNIESHLEVLHKIGSAIEELTQVFKLKKK